MSNKKKRILIVGGVAGGASAAARARRLSEDAEIILFERGKYISQTVVCRITSAEQSRIARDFWFRRPVRCESVFV